MLSTDINAKCIYVAVNILNKKNISLHEKDPSDLTILWQMLQETSQLLAINILCRMLDDIYRYSVFSTSSYP